MSLPEITSHDRWLAARKELLVREKEFTRLQDALNADRRRLPMVRIDKPYRFEGPAGEVGLVDLFEGRRQLMLQHFMFDPSGDDGCSSCSAGADELSDGPARSPARARHDLRGRFAGTAREDRELPSRKGWTFPWYSSYGSDFNYDFHATIDESVAPLEVNYRTRERYRGGRQDEALSWILNAEQPFEMPGISCFLRDGDDVFHTYSTFARGTEALGGGYAFLDLTALGRQEEWEEPKGRAASRACSDARLRDLNGSPRLG